VILALLAACAGGDTADTGDTAGPVDTAETDDGTWAIVGGAKVDGLGNAVIAEDLDGDAQADLLVAAYLGNRVCLVRGPLATGLHGVDAVGTCLSGEVDADYAGYGIAAVGDLDGDGVPEAAVGSIGYGPDDARYLGKVYLLPGTWAASGSGATLASVATATLLGEAAGDYAGLSIAPGGDLTGDGLPDLVVGASGFDGEATAGAGGGRAYIVAGPLEGEGALADAWGSITGLGAVVAPEGPPAGPPADGGPPPHGSFGVGDFVGDALAGPGDFDGDGAVDLALGASGDATLGANTGKAIVWFGPLQPGAGGVLDADVTLTGPAANAYAGSPLRALPDLDGDGRDELLVSGDGLGVVWIVSPSAAGTFSLADAPIRIEGRDVDDTFGAAVAFGELDGDGLLDLLIGAPSGGTDAVASGMTHAVLGGFTPGVHPLGDTTFYGVGLGDGFGRAVAIGDLDGDGRADLVTGAPASDVGEVSFSGGVWIAASPWE
jgi:hypothetical protein